MTTTMTPLNGTDRAAAVRAAHGQPAPTQHIPMGIRVTKGPGASPATPTAAPEDTPSTPTTPSTPHGVEDLLRMAAGSDLARTRHLGAKIAGLVEDLTARIEAEQEQRREREAAVAQRRELAEAEATLASQLAEVRQKLRGTGRDSAASPQRSKRRPGADQRAEIRAWAVANGFEVADRGRISRQITEAYAAATGSEVAR
ncbi:histone-like nucleoid-structuring protein Lsr2 [Micromonospora sp. NPDC049903]|uniref:Lsr2 family DNA-binding protein n=1 Tax=Micromonospora sp. NPDC049903 TaxID=3364276 RepID=UPI00379DEA1B